MTDAGGMVTRSAVWAAGVTSLERLEELVRAGHVRCGEPPAVACGAGGGAASARDVPNALGRDLERVQYRFEDIRVDEPSQPSDQYTTKRSPQQAPETKKVSPPAPETKKVSPPPQAPATKELPTIEEANVAAGDDSELMAALLGPAVGAYRALREKCRGTVQAGMRDMGIRDLPIERIHSAAGVELIKALDADALNPGLQQAAVAHMLVQDRIDAIGYLTASGADAVAPSVELAVGAATGGLRSLADLEALRRDGGGVAYAYMCDRTWRACAAFFDAHVCAAAEPLPLWVAGDDIARAIPVVGLLCGAHDQDALTAVMDAMGADVNDMAGVARHVCTTLVPESTGRELATVFSEPDMNTVRITAGAALAQAMDGRNRLPSAVRAGLVAAVEARYPGVEGRRWPPLVRLLVARLLVDPWRASVCPDRSLPVKPGVLEALVTDWLRGNTALRSVAPVMGAVLCNFTTHTIRDYRRAVEAYRVSAGLFDATAAPPGVLVQAADPSGAVAK